MKVLEGKHVYLSPYEERYLMDIYLWENNFDELDGWQVRRKISSYNGFKNKIESSIDGVNSIYLFVVEKKSENLIGYIGSNHIDIENGNFFVSTYIKPVYRKTGVNIEAGILFFNYMFKYFPVKKAISGVFSYNKDSLDNAISAGFKVEGIRKKHVFVKGEYHDEYLIAMFKEDFYNIFDKYIPKNSIR